MSRITIPHVIVLLPGITGSRLKKNDKTIWGYSAATLGGTLLTRGNMLRKTLALPDDPLEVDDLEDGIVADALMPDLHLLPGFWKIDGYSKIVRAIKELFRVIEGENFFQFPYDWRRDNRIAARKLAQSSHDWLARWRKSSGNVDARLILVAHSMGGLVSRYFVEAMEGWKNTEALITFGTPYRGSLNALDILSNGMRKGPFGLIDLSEMARQFTSIYQLLPIYKCYDPGDGKLVRVSEVADIPNVDPAKAAAALQFHREIEAAVAQNQRDSGYMAKRYAIYPVVGVGQRTEQSARISQEGVEMLQTYNGKDLSGDGTVPRVSAVPIELSDSPNAMYAATQHGSLQNTNAVLVQLEGILSGSEIDLGEFRKAQAQVAIDIDDLFCRDETISIRARCTTPESVLSIAAYRSGEKDAINRETIKTDRSGKLEVYLPAFPAGSYRIEIGGDDVEIAESAFSVADAAQEEIES